MLILFSFIVMRVTGVIELNSVLSRSEFPGTVKGMFVFMISLMIYVWTDGMLMAEPETLLEYAFMLIKELGVGACIGFGMELTLAVVRFGGTVIDFMMGLNMAQMYDPASNQQITPNANLFAIMMSFLFFTTNGHLRYLGIIYDSIRLIPFGQVHIDANLSLFMIDLFNGCIVLGLTFALPLIAIELLAEIALGVLMRVIPQLNIFSVNFQLKIIVGMVMLLVLYTPMSEMLINILEQMYSHLDDILLILAG
ncbi:flagellar biosynthetic protein FliR [Oribacterium sp. WCC10]|uniref:flagellar biosynthetic protein FliR n=1 Tax=Oribacterium sp. WCC10 TaxID=1855343 RepID=UPI0008EA0FC6|nr:flagellar biosynthetic protein FliR [Oribacterium sp. WCC10]SFG24840.1 flagellar biosynthetic protein FliR [Oribacterium sp. WCC10]